ncbi:MAG TPA: efflux RND transporter periplasmic adaptor subunit [Hyphomicrobiales bacterium]|nr:efflux RND transporter periplasmic adaptor subunit [Hyphomicrobiales bacterium]
MALKKWFLTFVACALLGGALALFKIVEIREGMAAAAAFPEQSATVEVAEVQRASYRPTITVMGEMVAPQRLDLRNEIAGEIVAINVAPGADIRQGQVLVQLDTSIEEANLAAAQAREELARLVFERAENLFQSKVTTREQLDTARADLAAISAEIRALQRTIDKKTLRAPFNGRAGLHTLEVGQFVPSNTLITSLIGTTDHIWVDFQVPQFYARLPQGAGVTVSLIGNERGNGTAVVIAENTVLNASNRSRSYRARFDDAERRYMANTMVQVEVPTNETRELLQVPAVAVQNDPLGQFVFVLRGNEGANGFRAQRQQITVALVEDGRALLENDGTLMPGDRIAAAGAFKLYDGLLVFTAERERAGGGSAPGGMVREQGAR